MSDDPFASLSNPAQRGLAAAGYRDLTQISAVTERELLQLHGLGPKSIRQLREMLAAAGLSFKEG